MPRAFTPGPAPCMLSLTSPARVLIANEVPRVTDRGVSRLVKMRSEQSKLRSAAQIIGWGPGHWCRDPSGRAH